MSSQSLNTQNSIVTWVVDNLEKDGAICNSISKEYDISETLKGGIGDRLLFKQYNDRIDEYQKILEFLEGERRASITESIPVIDFANKQNTGFLNHYYVDTVENSGSYNYAIESIPLNAKKSDLDLIKEKDPYMINRALAGLTMSEHFYNTSGQELSDTTLQVDVPDLTNPGYIYKGSISHRDPFSEDANNGGIEVSSKYYPSINIWKISQTTQLYFSDLNAVEMGDGNGTADSVEYKNYNNEGRYVYLYQKEKGVKDIYVLNPMIRKSFFVIDGVPKKAYKFKNGNSKYIVDTSNSDKTQYYVMNLQKDDILVLIPKTSYSLDSNKFVLFKKNGNGTWQSFVLFFSDAVGIPDSSLCKEVNYDKKFPLDE